MSAPSESPIPGRSSTSARGQQADREPDREVDDEDPVPADRLGEHAAGEQSDRGTGGGDERVDADRLRLLPRLREHGHDHPQDHGRGDRASGTLDEAGADQHPLALREGTDQRRRGEDREPGEEDPPLADQVAEPAREQQEAAERDQVGVDDPGQARLREAQVLLNRGQGDVDDRRVEHDHQHSAAEHVQRQPAVLLGPGRHFTLLFPTSSFSVLKTAQRAQTHRRER